LPVLLYGQNETINLYHLWVNVLRDTAHFPFLKYTNQSIVAVITRLGGGYSTIGAVWVLLNGFSFYCLWIFIKKKSNALVACQIFTLVLTVPSIVWQEYYVVLLLPYLLINQKLIEGKLGKIGVSLWLVRLLSIHCYTPAIVGRDLSIAANEWGNLLFGIPILSLILLLSLCEQRSDEAIA
jgi:hypothetical protein